MAGRESQTRHLRRTLSVFSRISMPRLRPRWFRERSSFPEESLWSLMEFSKMRTRDLFQRLKKIYLVIQKNRIIRYIQALCHEFIRILGRLLLIAFRSIFHKGQLSCVLQINRISCSCGISPVQASIEIERERASLDQL